MTAGEDLACTLPGLFCALVPLAPNPHIEMQSQLVCLRQVRLLVADVGGVENIVAAMRAHQHQEHVQCAGCLALVRAVSDPIAYALLSAAQAFTGFFCLNNAVWNLACQGRAVQVEAQGLHARCRDSTVRVQS